MNKVLKVMEDNDSVFDDYYKRYGVARIRDSVAEESSELVTAMFHWERGRIGVEDVAKEIADVLIGIRHLIKVHEVPEDLLAIAMASKLKRAEQRMRDELRSPGL